MVIFCPEENSKGSILKGLRFSLGSWPGWLGRARTLGSGAVTLLRSGAQIANQGFNSLITQRVAEKNNVPQHRKILQCLAPTPTSNQSGNVSVGHKAALSFSEPVQPPKRLPVAVLHEELKAGRACSPNKRPRR